MGTDFLSLASTLIRCGNGPESNAAVQAAVSESLTALGARTELLEVEGVQNAYIELGDSGPLLVFVGHSDVVSTGETALWSYPPFAAQLADGKLFGRGAVDMRASVATFAVSLANVWPEISNSIRVGLVIAGDEETKCKGAKAILSRLEARGERIALCLVGEPSAKQHTGDQIRIGRRGSVSGWFEFTGEQGHVAYSKSSANILHQALDAATCLKEIIWESDPAPWPELSFHITNFTSGTGESNVVPPSASFGCNIRFGPNLTREQVIERCEVALGSIEAHWTVRWSAGCTPYYTVDKAFPELVTAAVSRALGIVPALAVDGGTSDGRFFAEVGIPTVELGTPARSLHEINEAVELQDLERLQLCFQEVLRGIARMSSAESAA